MKFGTRYLNGREQAIVRGSDGAIRALADVTEAAGLGELATFSVWSARPTSSPICSAGFSLTRCRVSPKPGPIGHHRCPTRR